MPDAGELRVGLVGFGAHMAENLYPALLLTPGVRVVALSSRDGTRARSLADRYGIRLAFDASRNLITSGEVDAVVVSATPAAHAEVAADALAAGVHVFVEKPPAPDLPTLEMLAERERRASAVTAFVGYNFRFAELVTQAADLVRSAGALRGLKIRFVAARPSAPLWDHGHVERSYLYAVGIHAIDLATAWFGTPTALNVAHLPLGPGRFSLTLILSFPGGRQAILDLGNYGTRFESDFELIGQHRRVARVTNLRRLTLHDDEAPRHVSAKAAEEFELSGLRGGFGASGYTAALAGFFRSIRDRTPSPSPIAASLPTYEVIEQCLSAIAPNHPQPRPRVAVAG